MATFTNEEVLTKYNKSKDFIRYHYAFEYKGFPRSMIVHCPYGQHGIRQIILPERVPENEPKLLAAIEEAKKEHLTLYLNGVNLIH